MSENLRPKSKEFRKGKCPDEKCGNWCYFPTKQETVECKNCGQVHKTGDLLEKTQNLPVEDLRCAFADLFKQGPKDAEAVKVNGLSNYQCKLISSLMTFYGLDKETGSAKLLSSMPGKNEKFDCSKLGNRAFVIEERHLSIQGYGIDRMAQIYLKSVLEEIKEYNKCKNHPLVPIHADGDGHCLVHAISRCLVGRELFWHPLMTNLKEELTQNIAKYQMQFGDFIENSEWQSIIDEADPCYEPFGEEPTGLRNMHIFALANVLHRPIILLDSLDGLSSFADYSGLFLPIFVAPENCREKDGTQNKPLAISWSSKGRNHFVSLVGIKNQDICMLPANLIPKTWGGFQDFIPKYLNLADDGSCVIAGNNSIKDSYLQDIIACMERKFKEINNVSASVVADYYHNIIKSKSRMNIHYEKTINETKRSIAQESLHQCISCGLMVSYEMTDEQIQCLFPGGTLYEVAKTQHNILQDGLKYFFPGDMITCRYDKDKDRLFFHLNEICEMCSRDMRVVDCDGNIKYRNGDHVQERGNKVFWDGKLYDFFPEKIEVDLSYRENIVQENVFWFYKESDPSRNSNAFEIAQRLVQKHYPSEFGSQILVQQLSDQILEKTAHFKSDIDNSSYILKQENQPLMHNETTALKENNCNKKANITKTTIRDATANKKKQKSVKSGLQSQKASSVVSSTGAVTMKTKADSQSATKRSVRITGKGKSSTIELPVGMTYADLGKVIEEQLGIPCKYQQIKAGFPPKPMKPTDNVNEPVPLKHGDKVLVEEITMVEVSTVVTDGGLKQSGGKKEGQYEEVSRSPTEEKSAQEPEREKQDRSSPLAKNLSGDVFKGVVGQPINSDLWEAFANSPDCFKRGGVIFSLVQNDFGELKDGEHLTLPFFPNKVLCYNRPTDEIQICLGDRHIPVPSVSDEIIKAAAQQMKKYSTSSVKPKCSVVYNEDGTKRNESKPGIVPFSGLGQSLRTSEDRQPLDKEQSEKPSGEIQNDLGKDKELLDLHLKSEAEDTNDQLEGKSTENHADDSGISLDCID